MRAGVRELVAVFLFVVAGTVLLEAAAFADMYKYTDGSGAVVITNKKESVPAKYRHSMKVIKEDAAPRPQKPLDHDPETEEVAPAQKAPAAAEAVPEGKFAALCFRYPWLKPVAYVLGALVAFFAVIKLTSLLPSAQLARTICVAFFLGVLVFVYKTYVDYVASSYFTIRNRAMETLKKSNERSLPQLNEDGNAPPAAK